MAAVEMSDLRYVEEETEVVKKVKKETCHLKAQYPDLVCLMCSARVEVELIYKETDEEKMENAKVGKEEEVKKIEKDAGEKFNPQDKLVEVEVLVLDEKKEQGKLEENPKEVQEVDLEKADEVLLLEEEEEVDKEDKLEEGEKDDDKPAENLVEKIKAELKKAKVSAKGKAEPRKGVKAKELKEEAAKELEERKIVAEEAEKIENKRKWNAAIEGAPAWFDRLKKPKRGEVIGNGEPMQVDQPTEPGVSVLSKRKRKGKEEVRNVKAKKEEAVNELEEEERDEIPNMEVDQNGYWPVEALKENLPLAKAPTKRGRKGKDEVNFMGLEQSEFTDSMPECFLCHQFVKDTKGLNTHVNRYHEKMGMVAYRRAEKEAAEEALREEVKRAAGLRKLEKRELKKAIKKRKPGAKRIAARRTMAKRLESCKTIGKSIEESIERRRNIAKTTVQQDASEKVDAEAVENEERAAEKTRLPAAEEPTEETAEMTEKEWFDLVCETDGDPEKMGDFGFDNGEVEEEKVEETTDVEKEEGKISANEAEEERLEQGKQEAVKKTKAEVHEIAQKDEGGEAASIVKKAEDEAVEKTRIAKKRIEDEAAEKKLIEEEKKRLENEKKAQDEVAEKKLEEDEKKRLENEKKAKKTEEAKKNAKKAEEEEAFKLAKKLDEDPAARIAKKAEEEGLEKKLKDEEQVTKKVEKAAAVKAIKQEPFVQPDVEGDEGDDDAAKQLKELEEAAARIESQRRALEKQQAEKSKKKNQDPVAVASVRVKVEPSGEEIKPTTAEENLAKAEEEPHDDDNEQNKPLDLSLWITID